MLCPTIMNKISEAYIYINSSSLKINVYIDAGGIKSICRQENFDQDVTNKNCADCVDVHPGSSCV